MFFARLVRVLLRSKGTKLDKRAGHARSIVETNMKKLDTGSTRGEMRESYLTGRGVAQGFQESEPGKTIAVPETQRTRTSLLFFSQTTFVVGFVN